MKRIRLINYEKGVNITFLRWNTCGFVFESNNLHLSVGVFLEPSGNGCRDEDGVFVSPLTLSGRDVNPWEIHPPPLHLPQPTCPRIRRSIHHQETPPVNCREPWCDLSPVWTCYYPNIIIILILNASSRDIYLHTHTYTHVQWRCVRTVTIKVRIIGINGLHYSIG